jgi:hypothetical protein
MRNTLPRLIMSGLFVACLLVAGAPAEAGDLKLMQTPPAEGPAVSVRYLGMPAAASFVRTRGVCRPV